MSAKNSFNSMDPKAMQGMPQNEAMMLQKALSDPKTAEKILSSPQARAIFKKLQGK